MAITDANGTVTDRLEYDAYGRMTTHTGDSFVIFCYNGRDGVVTDKNGLIYMRARYYSPELCRFVNADLIHGSISHSVTLNRYAYANGNPVSFVDPHGKFPVLGWLLFGLGMAALTGTLTGCVPEQDDSESNNNVGEDTTEDYSWVDEDPVLSQGRYASEEEALLGNYERILSDAQNIPEETGYILYELYGGYYVGLPQGGWMADEDSVTIDLYYCLPEDAKPIATIHTHLKENENLLYRPEEYQFADDNDVDMYVVDINGSVYVLYDTAKNYMDYEVLIDKRFKPYSASVRQTNVRTK